MNEVTVLAVTLLVMLLFCAWLMRSNLRLTRNLSSALARAEAAEARRNAPTRLQDHSEWPQ